MNFAARALAAASCTAALATPAAAELFFFNADLSGDQQTPPVTTGATGTLTGTYDDVDNTFSYQWDITDDLNGAPSAPGAHIHEGEPGVSGNLLHSLSVGSWPLSGSGVWANISDESLSELFNGGLYVDFHTTEHNGGELRGQITLIPAPATAAFGLAGAGLALTRRRRA